MNKPCVYHAQAIEIYHPTTNAFVSLGSMRYTKNIPVGVALHNAQPAKIILVSVKVAFLLEIFSPKMGIAYADSLNSRIEFDIRMEVAKKRWNSLVRYSQKSTLLPMRT